MDASCLLHPSWLLKVGSLLSPVNLAAILPLMLLVHHSHVAWSLRCGHKLGMHSHDDTGMGTHTIHGKICSRFTDAHALLCRHYIELKQMMHSAPEVVHAFLDHLTEALIVYVCYQIDSGAQASTQCLTPGPHCLSSSDLCASLVQNSFRWLRILAMHSRLG